MAFFIVYIEEAHSTDLWQVPQNVRQNVLIPSARTGEDRVEAAAACVRNLKIELPALVDGIDNVVERAYTGWPDRLYVVDGTGRIAYKSAPGPFGFKPREMEEALVRTLR